MAFLNVSWLLEKSVVNKHYKLWNLSFFVHKKVVNEHLRKTSLFFRISIGPVLL